LQEIEFARKENGRKMADFDKVWNLQGTEKARKRKWNLQGKKSARNGIWKEMLFARNGICKKTVS